MSWIRKLLGRFMPAVKALDAFAQVYGVELLFESPPTLSLEQIREAIRQHCPAAQPWDTPVVGNSLGFVHPDHLVRFTGETGPAQTIVTPVDKFFEDRETLEAHLQQSRNFPEARAVVEKCRHAVLVSDVMSGALEYKERLGLFQDALAGVLSALPARAIHWRPTGQFIDPERYLDAYKEGGASRFLAGSLNVRLFNIDDATGETLMDTLGLAALGQIDIQCHYRDLEPSEVATVLTSTGWYIFEHGDVIEDGHTIEGLPEGSQWRCQHEMSILEPSRFVLDLDPGPPYAAGSRKGKG